MSATEYLDYCYSAFMQLDDQTRLVFVLALFFTILLFSWLHLLIKWSIKNIIVYLKNRGNKNV